MRILSVFGTRPEAIKMAPLIRALNTSNDIESRVCVTAQHREMLDQVLDLFEIDPDYDLNIMKHGQSLSYITITLVKGLESIFKDFKPDLILVHGDTSTTFCASLSAYYQRIAIGHIEAGLRTNNLYSPWPEEGNRKLTSALATIHFAPTNQAKENLLLEGIRSEKIYVTGNTVIDALLWTKKILENNRGLFTGLSQKFSILRDGAPLVLITGHRRENIGQGFNNICQAIRDLSHQFPGADFVYPVHLNPNVREVVWSYLQGHPNIFLIEPQDYLPFVYLMIRSHIILTDSGGIQEEAPSLGKPVLVMRETTERPEAVSAGTVRLVGPDYKAIVSQVSTLLTDNVEYNRMSFLHNPYGDGKASERIADTIRGYNTWNYHPVSETPVYRSSVSVI